ncbi:hypothetical protein KF840_22260 [bacterium]|nr:hypothetical protein [bacterium]
MSELGAVACWRCGAAIDARQRIGRRDACLACGADLHCCRNCRFHDPAMHNECREPQAERQLDRERGNFCEWFSVAARRADVDEQAAAARARLDAMFGRKA